MNDQLTSSSEKPWKAISVIVATALTSLSLGIVLGYEHGTVVGYEAALVGAKQKVGHRSDQAARGTGADRAGDGSSNPRGISETRLGPGF